ncbi:hypothetical protein J132_06047 [Termitomyces sp. J132]|nr:hypothetical protein J132_06047 [Termitomyces sp. J132]
MADHETFVDVWFDRDGATKDKEGFYGEWSKQASAKHTDPLLAGADALRRLYPGHSVVLSTDFNLNILNHPGVVAIPVEQTPLVTNTLFVSVARGIGAVPGVLIDLVQFGVFKVAWSPGKTLNASPNDSLSISNLKCPSGFGTIVARYLVYDGPEEPSRLLLLTVGTWSAQVHDEIWVYNQGFWQKDHELWLDVQKGNWEDVILNHDFKKALQKDVYGFFTSEKVYKELGIPWKVSKNPYCNGKTISLKVIMKTCEEKGFLPLYVKSFQSWMGEERSMAEVFSHARKLSPCLLVLEDLDSLINDRNRFFLNQLDGLTGNDGLLVIGTTNHLERLDTGMSNRPSRFDRKFKFDDPDLEGRTLYAKYWQIKLKDNKNVSFTDKLVIVIATSTEKFSFAYLKETFVSSLVELASFNRDDSEKPSFEQLIYKQIRALRKGLEISSGLKDSKSAQAGSSTSPERLTRPNNARLQSILDTLSTSVSSSRRKDRVFLDVPARAVRQPAPLSSDGEYAISLLPESDWIRDVRERVNRLKMWGDQENSDFNGEFRID